MEKKICFLDIYYYYGKVKGRRKIIIITDGDGVPMYVTMYMCCAGV